MRITKPSPYRLGATLVVSASLGGCFIGDENAGHYSTPSQIKAAAARCWLKDFEATKAGAARSARVDTSIPDYTAKEDCIYADLSKQGLLTTR